MSTKQIIQVAAKLQINLDDLRHFLLYAKPLGYAAENPITAHPRRLCFKDLAPISQGLWVYHDSYTGSYQAPGQEWITYDGVPVWMMAYAGGMVEAFWGNRDITKETIAVLKEALRRPDENLPLRGPGYYPSGLYAYRLAVKGNLTFFQAEEVIDKGSVRHFHQYICGGIVIHKL